MESFNAVGAVQITDNGAPIDTVATVPIGATCDGDNTAPELRWTLKSFLDRNCHN